MNRSFKNIPHRQDGFILIAAMLILLIVTIIGTTMFHGFGLEEKISGNTREKNRARHAAESAMQYAEWWLSNGSNSTLTVNCTGTYNANINQGAVCSNSLPSTVTGADVTQVPWLASNKPIGVTYTPPNFLINGGAGGANNYYAAPMFYIAYVGTSADGQGSIYRIDSVGYGGTSAAVAVLESTYEISSGVKDLGAL